MKQNFDKPATNISGIQNMLRKKITIQLVSAD